MSWEDVYRRHLEQLMRERMHKEWERQAYIERQQDIARREALYQALRAGRDYTVKPTKSAVAQEAERGTIIDAEFSVVKDKTPETNPEGFKLLKGD